MKRIIVVCEGETEVEFCKRLLAPHFHPKEVFIKPTLIEKTMGGMIGWHGIKKQVIDHIKKDKATLVTTLIDYYGIEENHQFPKWNEAMQIVNKYARMDFLEKAMAETIEDALRYKFLPYLQLHEFEALLFSDLQAFYDTFSKDELVGEQELLKTFHHFENPELINDKRATSPSHRLTENISGYNKVVYGNILAEKIGLENIRRKCKRFDNWLQKIENL